MRKSRGFFFALVLAAFCAATSSPAVSGDAAPSPRIEARSANLLAVGLVHDDRMSIHLSRLVDNSPVRDASVTLVLRGTVHPATAETDGSYAVQTKDLSLPGSATIEFQVTQAAGTESLKGTLQTTAGAGLTENKNNGRQLWWWVLNFAVCIGFLWLISRRRKTAQT